MEHVPRSPSLIDGQCQRCSACGRTVAPLEGRRAAHWVCLRILLLEPHGSRCQRSHVVTACATNDVRRETPYVRHIPTSQAITVPQLHVEQKILEMQPVRKEGQDEQRASERKENQQCPMHARQNKRQNKTVERHVRRLRESIRDGSPHACHV